MPALARRRRRRDMSLGDCGSALVSFCRNGFGFSVSDVCSRTRPGTVAVTALSRCCSGLVRASTNDASAPVAIAIHAKTPMSESTSSVDMDLHLDVDNASNGNDADDLQHQGT